jgi:hypothetical protein
MPNHVKTISMLCLFCLLLLGCKEETSDSPNTDKSRAQSVVDSAIVRAGGDILDRAQVSFRFRVRDYVYRKENGRYTYTRIYEDTTGTVTKDVLTNDGLTRMINGDTVKLDSMWTSRYSNSVNSVIYFAFLPYRLNDEAVIKTYSGIVPIKGKDYHEILVQFREEGGGKDHDDNFLYWFDTETFALDYLAYAYITDGGGVRFREAYNRRKIDGISVQDYINYKPVSDSFVLADMRQAFEAGLLVELSRIELENVEVERL